MKENFKELRKKFNIIKNMELIESMRKGNTGVGYTFETLIGKTEDTNSLPDYNGIEIKTKLGYSKSPLTLFNCTPKRNNESAINYILDNYSWLQKNSNNIYVFSNEVYFSKKPNKYTYFKLDIDYFNKKIFMKSYKNDVFIENVCYWDFKDLMKKLYFKINYLAIIQAYPYKKNNKIYYKYVKMNSYKLKGFFEFLEAIRKNEIKVLFYMKRYSNNSIDNHGVSFSINIENINNLFYKLKY